MYEPVNIAYLEQLILVSSLEMYASQLECLTFAAFILNKSFVFDTSFPHRTNDLANFTPYCF